VAAKKKRPKDTPERQHARFVEAAEKAEADEAPDAMDKALKRVDLRSEKKQGRARTP
jgi:DNA-binding GntR family transcriptional regulator